MPNPPTRPLSLDDALGAYATQAQSLKTSAAAKATAFTAAAGAALALAPSADAAIQYSGIQNLTIDLRTQTADPISTQTDININAFGTATALLDTIGDFRFGLYRDGAYRTASVGPLGAGFLGLGVVVDGGEPARLNPGAVISSTSNRNLLRSASSSALASSGNWLGGTMSVGAAHFLGVGFGIPNGSVTNRHFAWIRVGIETNDLGQPVALTVYDWAWESNPETTIVAGLIPEPTPAMGLSLLAAGAAGLAAWRRRKRPAS